MLDDYSRDLTVLAKMGALDPMIGREEEIKSLIEILTFDGKSNPVLIGPPGVGKTCIVEGFAQYIAEGKVPEKLKEKVILQIDVAAIVGGTMYRGMMEERLNQIANACVENPNIILFFDEMHMMINSWSTNGQNFGNFFKPYLSSGQMVMIGATTDAEYKKFIEEQDPALARRFVRLRIDEPKPEDLKMLLQRVGKRIGAKYRVIVPEKTIDQVVLLAKEYLTDRYFPDKGIDLLKEALADKRFAEKSATAERARLTELDGILAEEIQALREKDIDTIGKALDCWDNEKGRFFGQALTVNDVNKVMARRSGAVVGDGQLDEVTRRISDLEKAFSLRIIGQQRTKEAILSAVKMLAAGIRKPNKPIGSFLFLGPSGSGKTETAKTIAAAFFGDESHLVRFDMSEYYDHHTVGRLVGSPPGYIGSDEDGLLFKMMSKNPFSVVLFDEIEKAHPQLFDIFLQLLDEGRVRDMKGNIANFKEAIVIITSNVGTEYYAGLEQHEFEKKFEPIQAKVLEKLKSVVRPEIINRIDTIIPFAPFTKEELKLVFAKLVKESSDRIHAQKQITYDVSDAAVKRAVDLGFDPQFGARPMKREVQKLEEMIAEGLLERTIFPGDNILVDADEKKYVLRKVYADEKH